MTGVVTVVVSVVEPKFTPVDEPLVVEAGLLALEVINDLWALGESHEIESIKSAISGNSFFIISPYPKAWFSIIHQTLRLLDSKV